MAILTRELVFRWVLPSPPCPKHQEFQPVGWGSIITGAMGGPCSGHLLVSQVPLMLESPVGQLNSLPLISQTGAKFPGGCFHKECSISWSKKKRVILPYPFLGVKESNLECDLIKHRKNCECCPVSLFIVRSLWLSWLEVLNCLKSLHVHKSSLVLIVKIVIFFNCPKMVEIFELLNKKIVKGIKNVGWKKSRRWGQKHGRGGQKFGWEIGSTN